MQGSARKDVVFGAARVYTVTVPGPKWKSWLKSAGVPSSKITVTADGAFASPECMRRAGSVEKLATTGKRFDGGPTVGVALRHWDVGVSPPHWERQLGEALDKFTESQRGRLVFIPFQTLDTEKENDVAVARRIASQLKSQADVTVLEERLTPAEIGEVIAGCDLVAGMRLHSVVLAVQAGVPVVALSYDAKVSALMERVGIPEFDISLRGLQSGALKELLIRALQQKRGISASLGAASEKLARKAGRNVALACELLQKPVKRKSLPPELVPIVARAIQGQIAAAKQMDQRMQSRQAQVEELSARAAEQHADNEALIEQAGHQREKVEELSACVDKQHADNEELVGQLEHKRVQVEELSACIRKQNADNEELIAQINRQREQVEELSARTTKQHADNEELISAVSENKSAVAKLREQLQGKDRFVLELEQRQALEKRELEKRMQELARDHTQALELSANLRQELATAQQSLQQLAQMINRRLSVRARRSLHKLLDISQARTPEPLRRAFRGLYVPLYRLVFPAGKSELETLDKLGSSNVNLRKDNGRPGQPA